MREESVGTESSRCGGGGDLASIVGDGAQSMDKDRMNMRGEI